MPIDASPVFDIKIAVLKEDVSLKKVYMDISDNHECIFLFSHDLEIVRAGTTITSMPQSDYCEEYKKFADEYDIRFIFENYVPTIDFYTVPQFDVCAMDSEGGYIGTIGIWR